MTGAHTQGPWEWDGGRLLRNVPGSHSETVLMIHDPVWQPMTVDANLIATAPELLEALKEAHRALMHYEWFANPASGWASDENKPLRAQLDTVIAKAEGRQS